jgi:hypothetical protein
VQAQVSPDVRVVDAAAHEQLRSVQSTSGDDDDIGEHDLALALLVDVLHSGDTRILGQHSLDRCLRA